MPLRLVFMGTPAFSVPTLEAILDAGHHVAAVYCQPPRRSGRGMAETKSPVHICAESHGIKVFTPLSLKGADEQEAFNALDADAAVVVAYGLLLPKAILVAPRLGCFNLHASALPRWRGAAPIQRAIMAGDTETAAIVMRMEQGLDTGPMCLVSKMPIDPDSTASELHDALSRDGARLMVEALALLERGALKETPQPAEGITYAAKIDKAEARLDFTKPSRDVHNLIRGLSPFPGAWFEVGPEGRGRVDSPEGTRERIKVLRAERVEASGTPGIVLDDTLSIACGSGAIRLIEVQRSGKRPQTAADLLRGFAIAPGTKL